jgi:outer membrane cobalamin receptor
LKSFHLSLVAFVFNVALLMSTAHAQAATLTGHVTDPDGRPVAGARIIVSNGFGTIAERTTDRAGTFEVAPLTPGAYDVLVVVDGFQADPVVANLSEADSSDLAIALRLSAVSESVVVSASQVDVPLSRAADTITVLTAADLEIRQIETVSDALRLVPGLTVTRSGGRGAITSLFPQGGSSNYTLVLVDGIRANDFGGGYDFSHLSVADIDRIEIVRGPESALFGSDAIGAVVQVVTRRGGPPRVGGFVEGGGEGTIREGADASGSQGRWSWGGGVEHMKSDGFTGYSRGGERVTNDDSHLSHASGSLGYKSPGGFNLLVTGNLTRDERGFPGPFGADPIGAFAGVDTISRGITDTKQGGIRLGHAWSQKIRQRIEANATDVSGTYTSPYGVSSNGTKRFDGRVQEDIGLSGQFGASVGAEFQHERGSNTYITGTTGNEIPVRRAVIGTFGELRYVRFDRLFVTGGVRVEHITRDAVEANPSLFRPAFPDQTVNSANPKVSVSYLVTDPASGRSIGSTRLRMSAGTGIRPPDAFEIAFTNNPNLKPERNRSVDFGIEQQLAGGAYVLGATAFFNRYEDLIVTVGTSFSSASRFQTDNISNAAARGLELSASARIFRNLTVKTNYTFMKTEILSIDGLAGVAPEFGDVVTPSGSRPYAVGDPLIRRPRHQGSLDVTYGGGRMTAFGEAIMRSRILDVEPNLGTFGGLFNSPGYAVVNGGASIRLTSGVSIYARVLNVLDRAYEETLGFPALSRTALVGFRVAASR